jgi:lipopolysaccharide/colanic/teichoic acid biosynthesis glycosyltransferase
MHWWRSMLAKRIFDLIAAIPMLLLLTPTAFCIALAIKLEDRGPVLFCQWRIGFRGRPFQIIKFRTMTVGTSGSNVTVRHDNRVTRTGRFLRKYKLDELPQLINVIKGEMSLVGPRPEVPEYVALWPAPCRDLVLSLPPGITDLASLSFIDEEMLLGASADPLQTYIHEITPRKLALYRQYARTRNFLLDLKIIMATICRIAGWRR